MTKENIRMLKNSFSLIAVIFSVLFLSGVRNFSFAQEENKLVNLTKQIIEAKSNQELYPLFEELKDLYFSRPVIKTEGGITAHEAGKDNKYTEFTEFLRSLSAKKKTAEPFVDYYIALTRYQQLKYLEEKQDWDEYFSQGNAYREEIAAGAQKAIQATAAKDALQVYARLILWQFHKDQQDVFAEQALTDLMNSVSEYSKEALDIKPIKEVADKLSSYGERGKSRELYKIYAGKLVASDIKGEELKNIALDFYKQGNLELSETIYDAYIERIAKTITKEELTVVLLDIAKLFAYKNEGRNDMLYAEKIFQKIEGLAGKDFFNEALIYLRAFNLEKAKEYPKAKDIYAELVRRFSSDAHVEEALYKIGTIYTYVLRDIKAGKDTFEKLAQKETSTHHVVASLYQLGLLNQWENDFQKAKDYYDKSTEKAGGRFPETAALVKQRIKEMKDAVPLEYNLRTFLDTSLKEDNAIIDMTKSNLDASIYILDKDKKVTINSGAYNPESGCMQVELQYLWSGDLGKTKPPLEELSSTPSFITSYADCGTKVINLVVVSPGGIIDRNIEMVDVY